MMNTSGFVGENGAKGPLKSENSYSVKYDHRTELTHADIILFGN